MYKNFLPERRTIFLRLTGDNFRAAGKFPTEQTSFALLNMMCLCNNPYGQFISTLWRGSKDRQMLDSHISPHFQEVKDAALNGINIMVNDKNEYFNVIVFL